MKKKKPELLENNKARNNGRIWAEGTAQMHLCLEEIVMSFYE